VFRGKSEFNTHDCHVTHDGVPTENITVVLGRSCDTTSSVVVDEAGSVLLRGVGGPDDVDVNLLSRVGVELFSVDGDFLPVGLYNVRLHFLLREIFWHLPFHYLPESVYRCFFMELTS
jgi:hypothetical protein